MKLAWWKYLSVVIILYSIIVGLLINVPGDVGMLDQTIRNLFYHVPMWFAMMLLLFASWIISMMALNSGKEHHDSWASALASMGLLAGFCGIFTGMLWASATWGTPWTKDPKLNGAAMGILIYVGYWLLRNSIAEKEKKQKISASYNVFVFPIFIALIWIMPKMTQSIHPGSGDTVGFNTYDLNQNMRYVFYPAISGWFLFFLWIAEIKVRIKNLSNKNNQTNEFQSFIEES